MIPIPPLYTIAAAVVGALSISNFILYKLWQGKVEEHANYVSQIEAANAQVSADNARRIAEAESAIKDVSLAWDSALRSIDSSYVSRLRGKDRSCAAVSGAAATAALTHDATAQSGSGAGSFEATCFEIERNAAVDAAHVLHLQDYVKRVCK